MKKIIKIISIALLALALQVATPTQAEAQCPMCRMSAESNLAHGGTAGKGLNAGILYMLATPYLLVLGVGIIWYRNRRKEEDDFSELEPQK